MVKKSTEPKRSSESMQARFCLMVKLMFASCRFLLDYSMLVKSYLYGVLVTPMMRKQDADELGTPSEERKPMTKAKKSRKAKKARKRKSSSHASPGATSSSSAPASSPSARASDLQVVVPVEEVIHLDSSNDLDPASQYHKKSATDVATGIDQESVDIALQTKSKSGGASRKDEEKLKNVEPVLDDGEIKRECLGSESEYSKKFSKECLENLYPDMDSSLVSRQVFAEFRMSEEGRIVAARIKKELVNLSTAKEEGIDRIVPDVPYFRVVSHMIFQAAYPSLKANFSDPKWREKNRFPKFSSKDYAYSWWYQNFDRKISRKRLGIMKEAAKIAYPSLEYHKLCVASSTVNLYVHPLVDLEDVTKMANQNKFTIGGVDIAPTLSSIMSGGSKTLCREQEDLRSTIAADVRI